MRTQKLTIKVLRSNVFWRSLSFGRRVVRILTELVALAFFQPSVIFFRSFVCIHGWIISCGTHDEKLDKTSEFVQILPWIFHNNNHLIKAVTSWQYSVRMNIEECANLKSFFPASFFPSYGLAKCFQILIALVRNGLIRRKSGCFLQWMI